MSVENSPQLFGGQFAEPRDRPRLRTQLERIRAWVLAREWFTLREASKALEQLYPTLFSEASLSTQLRNLEKPAAGRLRCKKEKRRRDGGLWEYRLRALPAQISTIPAKLQSDEPLPKISWPASLEDLEAAGYDYLRAGECRSCGKQILWHFTASGKKMPLTMIEGLRLVPHYAACETARQFRAAKARHEVRSNPRPSQIALFG